MNRILVLGSNGMLGSMVYGYLSRNQSLLVTGSTRQRFDAESFSRGVVQPQPLDADYIINCIGVIKPFCKDDDIDGVRKAITVNALFPYRLGAAAHAVGARVIQIATDCVYSGVKGQYLESDPHDPLDVYGKTKSLGEVFDKTILNLRCSIIGPETKNHVSLLDWFLANKDGAEVKGFTHHQWNGVTTLQFAKLCEQIIQRRGLYEDLLSISHLHHFVPNSTVSKYDLLNLMNDAFGRRIVVQPVGNVGPAIDRTLGSRHSMLRECFPPISMGSALSELATYMHKGAASR